MRAQVWVAMDGVEVGDGVMVELEPGRGKSLGFHLAATPAQVMGFHLSVVIEPEREVPLPAVDEDRLVALQLGLQRLREGYSLVALADEELVALSSAARRHIASRAPADPAST